MWSIAIAVVNYSKYQAQFIIALNAALGASTVKLFPDLGISLPAIDVPNYDYSIIPPLIVISLCVLYFIDWITPEMIKGAIMQIFLLLLIILPPQLYAFWVGFSLLKYIAVYGSTLAVMENMTGALASYSANYVVISSMWEVISGPFIVYLFVRKSSLVKRVQGIVGGNKPFNL